MNATIAQLRHFIALAESGSFTRAADHTRRSQAAFSRSISVLESTLGGELVERVGRGNKLTLMGRMVLAHARQVVAQVDELHQVALHHVSGHAGQIRIGLGPTPSALLSQPLLHFARTYPAGMRIRITRGPREQQLLALRNRQVDALVTDLRSIPLADSDLVVKEVAEMPLGAVCHSAHPLTQKLQPNLPDLLTYPIASTAMTDLFAKQLVARFGPTVHPDVSVSLESEDLPELLQAVCDSNAVYIGVLAPARSLIQQGQLVVLPFASEGLTSRIAWVQRKEHAPNPALDEIRTLVCAELVVQANFIE
ncbi:MAG: LysR family transcriptional regulator [Polaromonas sp.]